MTAIATTSGRSVRFPEGTGQVCDVLQGGGGQRVGGAGERGEAAQREAVETGEEEASVGGSGDGCVERNGRHNGHAEHVGDIPLGQRPPVLEHEDRPVEPPATASGECGEADVARPPEHGVVLDRPGGVDGGPVTHGPVEGPGGDAASIDHDHVVPGGCDSPAGGRGEVEVRCDLDHIVVSEWHRHAEERGCDGWLVRAQQRRTMAGGEHRQRGGDRACALAASGSGHLDGSGHWDSLRDRDAQVNRRRSRRRSASW